MIFHDINAVVKMRKCVESQHAVMTLQNVLICVGKVF